MKLLKRMLPGQAGQALPMVLVILFIGAMLIIPSLNLTTTNLKATQSVDEKTREMYAADAGIEDALWYLQSETRLEIIKPPGQPWPVEYNLVDNVNAKDVSVAIDSAWLLSDLLGLPADEPQPGGTYYANDHWTVVSALNIDVQPRNNYIVDITTNEAAEAAYVNHIAVWLPQGYSYKPNSVKINGVDHVGNTLLVFEPTQLQHRGGTALIWNYYGATTFKELSDIAPGGEPPVAKFPASIRLSIVYEVTPFTEARGFFPWMQLFDGRVAWDADAGFYHVESTGITSPTDNTTVEAYVPKGVMRYVSGSSGATSAIQGDYIAIGNSLMTCYWVNCSTCCTSNNPYRNYAPARVIFADNTTYPDAERESYATVDPNDPNPVPSDAKIERAYLYWTAWLRGDEVWKEKRTDPWLWATCMDADGQQNNWENCSLPTTPTVAAVKAWLAANAYDGKAYLAVNDTKVTPVNAADPAGTVVANTWYISEGSSDVNPSYQYSCFADVTAQVTAAKPDRLLSGAKFTVAGVHAHPALNCNATTWNRSANAGWSMVIIYSSAAKKTHQIYLYAGCDHLFNETAYFPITGFAAPLAGDLEAGETNEAKMTVFASEGDSGNNAEYLGFKGQQYTNYDQLYDITATPGVYTQYVFNSISSATGFATSTIYSCPPTTEISGIDIDTYTATKPDGTKPLSTIVQPGDISATIKAQSTGDGFELIYVVFSVRSTAVPAGEEFNVGSMMYRIE